MALISVLIKHDIDVGLMFEIFCTISKFVALAFIGLSQIITFIV